MTAGNKRSNRDGIFLDRVIACPVCGEKAHSFRIRRVISLRTVDGEFYHRTATCTGSMDARYAGSHGSFTPGG